MLPAACTADFPFEQQRVAEVRIVETVSTKTFAARSWLQPGEPGETLTITDRVEYLTEFPNEPYRVVKPIPVNIRPCGSGFMASWDDANIAMSGESASEAACMLAADILDTLEDYEDAGDDLGVAAARQLAVLREHIVAS